MKEVIIRGDFEIEGLPDTIPKQMAKHLKYCKIKLIPSYEMYVDSFSSIEEKTSGKVSK